MNLRIGSETFIDVEIPILWGTRAVVQDKNGRISVINLGNNKAVIEILGDKPAPNIEYLPTASGFEILADGQPLYNYTPEDKILRSINLDLPECQISTDGIRIGENFFSGDVVSGFAVGIAVTEDSLSIGAPMPKNLAKLVV